jgi:hypothetical protein
VALEHLRCLRPAAWAVRDESEDAEPRVQQVSLQLDEPVERQAQRAQLPLELQWQ